MQQTALSCFPVKHCGHTLFQSQVRPLQRPLPSRSTLKLRIQSLTAASQPSSLFCSTSWLPWRHTSFTCSASPWKQRSIRGAAGRPAPVTSNHTRGCCPLTAEGSPEVDPLLAWASTWARVRALLWPREPAGTWRSWHPEGGADTGAIQE